jgi:hypothetical protein
MGTGAFTRVAGVLMAGGLVLALLLDGAFVVLGVTVAVTAGILLALRLDPEHRPAVDEPLAPVRVGAEPVLDVDPGDVA